jgi:hypothetical protein
MCATNQRRSIYVHTFVQPHNSKPEFNETLIITVPAETPVAGNHDQHF